MIIVFEKSNGSNNFRDALHLPDGHTFTDSEIEDMKQQRFDNWVAHIAAASEIEEEPVQDING